jgi:hypothetical protein
MSCPSSDVDLIFTVSCIKINNFTESANTVTVRLRTGMLLKTSLQILENRIQLFGACSHNCVLEPAKLGGPQSSENERTCK